MEISEFEMLNIFDFWKFSERQYLNIFDLSFKFVLKNFLDQYQKKISCNFHTLSLNMFPFLWKKGKL